MPDIPNGLGSMRDLLKRFQKANERWELWRSTYQEAFDFAAPQRETFHQRSPGQRKNRHIFDSTAVVGLAEFANRIQGSIVPSWQQWALLKAGSDISESETEEVDAELEKTAKTLFDNLNHSNFDTEITPSLYDYGIGTGAFMIEEGDFEADEMFKFTNVPLAELRIENPYGGPVKTIWRKQKVGVKEIERLWPAVELTTKLKEMAEKDPSAEVDIINGMVFNPRERRYHHLIIYEAEKALLFEQSFGTQRLIVFRYDLTPGEAYGRGPVLAVMADIRTANKVKQFILENAAIQIAGMYTGLDDGIFNPHTVRIAPGTVIPVNSNNTQNPSLSALPRAGDIGLAGIVLSDLQAAIRKALFAEPLGDISDPVRSATENVMRMQEMLKQAGASLGRLKSELVEPLIAAGLEILAERGRVPELRVDGKEVAIKQTSPLAKAEDLEDFQNSQLWFGNVSSLADVAGREVVLGSVRVEALPQYWAEKLGVPAELSRSKDEQQQFGAALVEATKTGLLDGKGGGGGEGAA